MLDSVVVRVPVEVKVIRGRRAGRSLRSSGLVNTGYETQEPEIAIPERLAEDLGLTELAVETSATSPIARGRISIVDRALKVCVATEDKAAGWTTANVTIVPIGREVLLSDAITEELGIEIVKPKIGSWRLTGDERDKTRRSVRPQYW